MRGRFHQPTVMERDNPEFQIREEQRLVVVSHHEDGPGAFERSRREVERWWSEHFPSTPLIWAGGGDIVQHGRCWHRWLPETAAQATVLRMFWG